MSVKSIPLSEMLTSTHHNVHLVAVVAHPDDESFGCGSILAAAGDCGMRTTVICATRGEAGQRRPHHATDHLSLAEIREHELRAAADVLGVGCIELLDYEDSGFDGPLSEEALCAQSLDELAETFGHCLVALAPDVVVLLDGSDGHRDHRMVKEAVQFAFARFALNARLVESCLTNSLMRRWVEETRTAGTDSIYLALDTDTLGSPDDDLIALDMRPQLPRRERAIATHRSQRSPFDGLSADLQHAFLATAYLRDVHLATGLTRLGS